MYVNNKLYKTKKLKKNIEKEKHISYNTHNNGVGAHDCARKTQNKRVGALSVRNTHEKDLTAPNEK